MAHEAGSAGSAGNAGSAGSDVSAASSGWGVSPETVLRRLLSAVPRGPMLYAGPPGQAPLGWLVDEGFEPDLLAVEIDGNSMWAPSAGASTTRTEVRQPPDLPALTYGLVVLDGVLSFMPPRDGDALIAACRRATRPGGVVYAAAYALGDPECRRAAAPAAGGAAGRSAAGRRPVRCLLRGELAMAFEGWLLLHVTEGGVPDAHGRVRQVAVVSARRPGTGTLLA